MFITVDGYYPFAKPETRISKLEIRNKFQIRKLKISKQHYEVITILNTDYTEYMFGIYIF